MHRFAPVLIGGDALRLSRYVQVPVDDFVTLFADADPTYESLCAVDEAKRLGYRAFFDRCKDAGVL